MLRAMPEEAKEYLYHHLGNSLSVVTNALWLMERALEAGTLTERDYIEMAMNAAQHAMDDVRKIGRG
jgi:hypothetical protein